MAKKALEVQKLDNRDSLAKWIAQTWNTFNTQRGTQIELWKEIRNYVFATDTSTTSNKTLPWKNSTTLPKLCQIRDNLHSNYISALFPNDDWLQWEGYSLEDAIIQKRKAIEAYMSNKTRESHFRTTISQLVYDYIDYGNCFGTVAFESSFKEDAKGNRVPDFIGAKAVRISPLDIVFDPTAASFKESFKIIRSLRKIGDLYMMAEDEPENAYLKEALKKREIFKGATNKYFGTEDLDKADGFYVDGFGNYNEYLQSGYVEFLEFYGDIHDQTTNKVLRQHVVTVIDRAYVIRNEPIPTWFGHAPIYHAGWRKRPDNLWAMSPLENLVGMQYRIDHLENLKADAMDLAVLPPLKIKGEVEEFEYKPGAEIHIDENGDVEEMAKNAQWVIQCENDIQALEQRMEQFAGAPREAMGIRSPGEKTMFEVQQLQNAAGRIFQEKTTNFEIEFLEPMLNAMLESAKRNLDGNDVVRVMDNDLGIQEFINITRDDITASGKLRPIGARHFAAQSQLMQNLTGLANTQIWQQIAPHTSSKQLAMLIEDIMGLRRYQLFKPNIAIFEQKDTQRLVNQSGEDLETEASLPVEKVSP